MNAEQWTFVAILLASLGLLILNKLRNDKKLRAKLADAVDDIEEAIEDATGLDVEISDAVEEVLESVANKAEDVLTDVKEDGELDTDLEEVVDEIKEEVLEIGEELQDLTVAQLKDRLKELGLPVSGKKADLISRILENGGEN